MSQWLYAVNLTKNKPHVLPKFLSLHQHYKSHIPSSQEGPAYPGRQPQKFGFKQEPPLSHFLSQTAMKGNHIV